MESECSPQGSLILASDLPSGSLPSWVPLEDGRACVQIVYSIPQESDPTPVEETPGTERWQAQVMESIGKFQVIGWLLTFLLAALFMRTKARV